jgi:hypothetical protein
MRGRPPARRPTAAAGRGIPDPIGATHEKKDTLMPQERTRADGNRFIPNVPIVTHEGARAMFYSMFERTFASTLSAAIAVGAVAWGDDQTEFPYSGLSASVKATVKEYERVPEGVPKPSTIIRLPTGEIDHRDARVRYLHPNHPGVQPRPDSSTYRRYLNVPNFDFPPGTNLLPTVYQDARDGMDRVMVNTLPSTPRDAYHLHDGLPQVTPIDPTSPTDDLRHIMDRVYQVFTGISARRLWEELGKGTYEEELARVKDRERNIKDHTDYLRYHLKWAIDIIEGKSVPDRAYSGFALLHHSGQNRIKRVVPILGADGRVVGGHVEVKQIWFDQQIENDTMFLDFAGRYTDPPGSKLPPVPDDVPWTITYVISVLNRGSDDFAVTTMFFDSPEAAQRYAANSSAETGAEDQLKRQINTQYRRSPTLKAEPPKPPQPPTSQPPRAARPRAARPPVSFTLPHVAMDQTFFPMDS